MCGRFACTLKKADIARHVSYKEQSEVKEPAWVKISKLATDYCPCANIGPGSYTPVLFSDRNMCLGSAKEHNNDILFLTQMKWGLIPSWHKGNEESFKFKMINCRGDSLREKASFRKPFELGQRCVVLAEGFYEWKSAGGKKQPYFIKPSDKQLLAMAAVFDKWVGPGSEEPLYSYTIVTVDASESMNYIHDRMPAILESTEEMQLWLSLPPSKAFELIRSVNSLKWHQVSTFVNNVKNKSPECLKEIKPRQVHESTSSKLMCNWLKRSSKTIIESESQADPKQTKLMKQP